eukprot:CAMPEP_0115192970 /NCGR_PEP_ID=MMETSP0270-20121206/13314_1 /TAXON_ID=71861 /ORGANISM="Scrippsiella trochoidea, Strain CCMP3099" /LENGTH=118 /DNA_ID=CAMNT_0002606227 /DNA_START=526 /DNA_END=878 /DNA_ORIENTATION=-
MCIFLIQVHDADLVTCVNSRLEVLEVRLRVYCRSGHRSGANGHLGLQRGGTGFARKCVDRPLCDDWQVARCSREDRCKYSIMKALQPLLQADTQLLMVVLQQQLNLLHARCPPIFERP